MSKATLLFINPPSFAVYDLFRSSINPPLNLAYLISSFDGTNLDIQVCDLGLMSVRRYGLRKNNMHIERLLSGRPSKDYLMFLRQHIHEAVMEKSPAIVAMNADFYTVAFYCLREAKYVDPGIKCIVGGTVASDSYCAFLSKKQVDFVIIDEGEVSFRQLVLSLVDDNHYEHIEGIAYRFDGSIVRTPAAKPISLTSIKIPAYDCFDMESYLQINGNRLMILSARGCRGNCKFCGMPRHLPLRVRPTKEIVDEISQLKARYGVRKFTFFNSMMNINAGHLRSICYELMQRKTDIRFGCYLKADQYINSDTFGLLHSAGCDSVGFGIESGSQRMLDACNKSISIKSAEHLVQQAKHAGLRVRCTFIWGMPGETWGDFFRTLKVYCRMRPSCSGFFEFRVSETSEYYRNIEAYTHHYYEDVIRISMVRKGYEVRLKRILSSLMSLF